MNNSGALSPHNLPSGHNRNHGGKGEVVSDIDLGNIAYDRVNLDELLQKYLEARGMGTQIAIGNQIEQKLDELSIELAGLATMDGPINTVPIRQAFDRFYTGMDNAAAETGVVPHKPPKSLGDAILKGIGIRKHDHHTLMAGLDDKYWNEQFMREYNEGARVKRLPDESEQAYLARYIDDCLRGFAWNYFTVQTWGA